MGPGEAKPMPGPRARYHLERIRESVWDVVANGALKIAYDMPLEAWEQLR